MDRAKSMYDRGYHDGFRRNEKASASMLEGNVADYMKGYAKGIEDKDFCDACSDEALGVDGGI